MNNSVFKLRSWMIVFVAACCLSVRANEYPGNSNFRNVSVMQTATSRKDWVTNILDNALSYSFDWSKGQQLSPGVTFVPTILTTDAGWPRQMVCYCVRVDLTTPGLRFTGADRCPVGWGDPMPESNSTCANYESGHYPKRTVREKTSDFLARNRGSKSKGGKERNAVLAFNGAAWLPWTGANTNLWACPYSPLYSDGIQISNNRTGGVEVPNKTDPAPQAMFVQLKNGVSGIIDNMTEAMAKQTWFCVPAFVTGLVAGNWAALDNGDVAQRTAIGISQDGKTFYILVCDGRRDGWTAGCDFTSLSKILYGMGVWVGFNLDGGGSSTLCRWNESNGKPEVLNRQSSLRDNGSNIAIYYSEPVAMLGSYYYEDFDFMVQDIIDGETDGSGEINVLRDATFTAEHPYIPSGRYNLWSTNNSTIGWADGVTPQVAAGTIVRFRNIRFREGSRSLTVGAGATTVFDEGVDIDEVVIPNAGGLVIGGVPACPVRVSCATATGVGEVFATSSLSLANARVAAKKFACAANDELVAEAFEDGGTVKFKWCRPILLGDVTAKIASTLDRGIVTVPVTECAVDYVSGYRLKLTVTSEDGRRTATQYLAVSGVGEYTFDTTGASDPAICAAGYNFGYTVELVDSDGVHVANIPTISGQMSVGIGKSWFEASAADDSVVGGSWSNKPEIVNGAYKIAEGSAADFGASEQKAGRVRFEMDAVFKGYLTQLRAQAALEQFAKYGTPQGACFLAKAGSDDSNLAWRGLVKEGGEPVFKLLYGPAAINTPCKLITEVEWNSGVPYVRYSVAFNGVETVLADANGASWFPGASSASSAKGRVVVSGTGSVDALVGRCFARIMAGGYAAWIAENGITGEPGDTTGGIANAVRYAFNIDPASTTIGDPIIKIVFDANGHPSVQSRALAEGRDDVTFDVLATEDLADWTNATLIKMKKCDDGLWKPVDSEDSNYVFPEKMFYKYILDMNQ